MANPDFFGLELLKHIYLEDPARREDFFVVHVHFILVSNGYLCIGMGDDKKHNPDAKKSELLPTGWNLESTYLLRYVNNNELFLLRMFPMNSDLVVNLIRAHDMKIGSTVITMVDEDKFNVKQAVANFKTTVLDTLSPEPRQRPSSKDTKATSPPAPCSPRFKVDPSPPRYPEVGRSDLDPLGGLIYPGMPGGMLVQPPRHFLPHGGIRYDPIHGGVGPDADLFPHRRSPRAPHPDLMPPQFGDDFL